VRAGFVPTLDAHKLQSRYSVLTDRPPFLRAGAPGTRPSRRGIGRASLPAAVLAAAQRHGRSLAAGDPARERNEPRREKICREAGRRARRYADRRVGSTPAAAAPTEIGGNFAQKSALKRVTGAGKGSRPPVRDFPKAGLTAVHFGK
jgi:hypothetical protein